MLSLVIWLIYELDAEYGLDSSDNKFAELRGWLADAEFSSAASSGGEWSPLLLLSTDELLVSVSDKISSLIVVDLKINW